MKELSIRNALALPRVEKVVLNVGINRSSMEGREMQDYIAECLARISGQRPVFRTAKKAISNFKIRKGLVVGAMVTIRGKRMEEFLDRLVSIVLPRVRDFRGLSERCDGHGNFAIGITDHTVFPEVPLSEAGKIFGLQVQLRTTAGSDRDALLLLRHMGFPFRKGEHRPSTRASLDAGHRRG